MAHEMRFIKSPSNKWHYEKLGIDKDSEFHLHDKNTDVISNPYSTKQHASVFHVQEIMRISLWKLKYEIDEEFTTNKVQQGFHENSYHSDVLWNSWDEAVERSGGTTSGILQQILGVRIRGGGNWVPHFEPSLFICGDWAMIDDLRPTANLIETYGVENLWLSSETGLRLVKTDCIPSEHSNQDLSVLLGLELRFPDAMTWLNWCKDNGKSRAVPSDQGKAFYFRIPDDKNQFRYSYNTKTPDESWWCRDENHPSVARFIIDNDRYIFGSLWNYDDESKRYSVTYAHLKNCETEEIIQIGPKNLGIELTTNDIDDDSESEILGGKLISLLQSLRHHFMVETIKALRIILAVNGHLELPNLDDRNIGGLGLSGSKVYSAYSDMFFLSHYNKNNKSTGLVVGTPIDQHVRRMILQMNWYNVGD